jgi:hypothetical protein
LFAGAILSSAPNRECDLGPTWPCSAPDDRQVVAVSSSNLSIPADGRDAPATWGIWTYAGLLLAETGADATACRIG